MGSLCVILADCFCVTGYSDYQVYLLLSCAPVQGHVAGLVDVSNFNLLPHGCSSSSFPAQNQKEKADGGGFSPHRSQTHA